MTRVGAFFDLDMTLIDVNSGVLWAKHERSLGNIRRRQLAKAFFWHAMYRLSLIDMEATIEKAMKLYEGASSDELASRTREWFDREVAHRFRERAAAAVERHRSAGDALVILTNSSCYEAAVAAERWGFDDYLANQFPTDDDGRLLGTFEQPLCYGQGKVARAEAWARKKGVDIDRSFFYSDSYSDLPMLERVAQPRAVTPDVRLRRAARRRGWPVLDW